MDFCCRSNQTDPEANFINNNTRHLQQKLASLNIGRSCRSSNLNSHHLSESNTSEMHPTLTDSNVDFIPLNTTHDFSGHKKKTDHNPSSPPHGGKKRRENRERMDHSNGPPWVMRNYCAGMVGFHEEIEDFYNYMRPSIEETRMREMVIKTVEDIVMKLWPAAKLEVFGSFRTELYLPTSDIDIVLFGEWKHLPLWTLRQELVKKGIAVESSIKVLDRAAVPIIKFQYTGTLVKVDISFNMKTGVQSVKFIKGFLEKYPTLPKLIFVLKQFLLVRDLNEVWTGGVSSYSLLLMVISFLQLHPRQEARHGDANLAVLLVEFFELYGRHFNYQTTCIRVKDGGKYIHKDELRKSMDDGSAPSLLSIEDPLTPGKDLGRGSYAVLKAKQAFEFAYRTLTCTILQMNYNKYPISLLSLIVYITHDTIEYRRLARQRWIEYRDTPRVLDNADNEPLSHPPRCPTGSSGYSTTSVSSTEEETASPVFSSPESSSLSSTDSDSDSWPHPSTNPQKIFPRQFSSLRAKPRARSSDCKPFLSDCKHNKLKSERTHSADNNYPRNRIKSRNLNDELNNNVISARVSPKEEQFPKHQCQKSPGNPKNSRNRTSNEDTVTQKKSCNQNETTDVASSKNKRQNNRRGSKSCRGGPPTISRPIISRTFSTKKSQR